MRTGLLGLLGLVLAVAVGLGVHVLTRDTISLPVVQLEPAPALAPPAATRTAGRTTTERTETEHGAGAHDDPGRDGRRQLRTRTGPRAVRAVSGGSSGKGGGDD